MGYIRESRKRHATGTVVTIVDTEHDDNVLDPAGGRYVAICEDHNALCNFETYTAAQSHAKIADFCEVCMGVENDTDLYESIVRA